MAVQFGPISLLAVEFPDISKLQGELLQEIGKLSQAGIIRVIGLLAVAKDEKGEFAAVQATGLSEEDRMKLGAGIGALIGYGAAGEAGVQAGWEAGAGAVAEKVAKHDFGLSKEQVRDIAMDIPPGTAVGLVLIEHLWAKNFKEIGLRTGGQVLANAFISPDALVELGAQLAEGARIAEKTQAQLA
jgi:uncharacterized membrane protein